MNTKLQIRKSELDHVVQICRQNRHMEPLDLGLVVIPMPQGTRRTLSPMPHLPSEEEDPAIAVCSN